MLSTWDPKTLTRLHRLEGHTQAVMAAAWSKDGKHFASAGADGTVRIWDVGAGTQLHALTGHKGAASLVAWSPNGDLKFDPESAPNLIAIVEAETGQKTVSLDELKKDYGWKNNGKMLKLPTKD